MISLTNLTDVTNVTNVDTVAENAEKRSDGLEKISRHGRWAVTREARNTLTQSGQ